MNSKSETIDAEIDEIIDSLTDVDLSHGPSSLYELHHKVKPAAKAKLKALLLREREKGEAVGEYRVADNLYSLTTHIYLFGSQEKPEQLKIANESATEIVQTCEKYLNKNAKTYRNAMREQELSRLNREESHE